MLVSTKGRYALRFLIDLALHDVNGPVSLKSIAERQGVSKKYLERIVTLLGPSGMLQITRGFQGGYRLNRDPSMITVAEILLLTEGGFSPVPGEEIARNDASTYVWESLEGAITRCLENMTLQSIIDHWELVDTARSGFGGCDALLGAVDRAPQANARDAHSSASAALHAKNVTES